MPFPIIVCLGVKDVLLGHKVTKLHKVTALLFLSLWEVSVYCF